MYICDDNVILYAGGTYNFMNKPSLKVVLSFLWVIHGSVYSVHFVAVSIFVPVNNTKEGLGRLLKTESVIGLGRSP